MTLPPLLVFVVVAVCVDVLSKAQLTAAHALRPAVVGQIPYETDAVGTPRSRLGRANLLQY